MQPGSSNKRKTGIKDHSEIKVFNREIKKKKKNSQLFVGLSVNEECDTDAGITVNEFRNLDTTECGKNSSDLVLN